MSKAKELNIALLGLGTVGTGVAELLKQNGSEILSKSNVKINIVKVYERNADRLKRANLDRSLFCADANEIFADPSVDTVVELLGRIHPAKDYVEAALSAKKNVVTANKDLICMYGNELQSTAVKNGKHLVFEASCLGAVPAINTLKNNFLGDRIESIKGIMNGTTNFILSKMKAKGMSFDDALKLAQEKGYAESDPTNDVDGIDAAYKLCILSKLAFGVDVKFGDISTKSIRNITAQDILIAGKLGYTIKLIAQGKMKEGKLEIRVNPVYVPDCHQLASIGGAFNALTIKGNFSDEITLIGRGAGSFPTASAVVNDIVSLGVGSVRQPEPLKKVEIEKGGQAKFSIKFGVFDKPGILAKLAGCLAANDISIETVLQDKHDNPECKAVIILTHKTGMANVQNALEDIKKTGTVENVDSVIEILD